MAALPYSLLGLSRVSKPQQTTTSAAVLLNYDNFKDLGWLRYIKSALACFEPPWNAFRNVKWVAGELARVLEDIKPVCRRKQMETTSARGMVYNEDIDKTSDEEKELLVLFLCAVVTGIASAWEELAESFDPTPCRSSVLQRSQFPQKTSSSESIFGISLNSEVPDDQNNQFNSNDTTLNFVSTSTSHDLSDWNENDLEYLVLGCFSSVIENLSILTTSSALAMLVCGKTNNGLLFFECLSITDGHIRYDTLQLIQRLLTGGRLHHRNWYQDEVDLVPKDKIDYNPRGEMNHVRQDKLGHVPNNHSGIMGGKEIQSLEVVKALISSPHSIGNLMEVLEHEEADFVRNECLNVLLILLSQSEELRRITTFQNLPENLMSIISNEIFSDDSIPIDSDITVVCYDCLRCIQFLFCSQPAQKYFDQTGLIFRLVELLSFLLTGSSDLPGSQLDNEIRKVQKSPCSAGSRKVTNSMQLDSIV